jgi:hypothetical protein
MGYEMPVPGDFQDIRGRVGIDGRDYTLELRFPTQGPLMAAGPDQMSAF